MVIARLGQHIRRVRSPGVLGNALLDTAAGPPGAESKRCRKPWKERRRHLPQCTQDSREAEALGEPIQRRLTVCKKLRKEPLEEDQRGLDGLDAPTRPPQHSRQLDLQAQIATGRLQTVRLLHGTDHRFDLGQGARQARRQTVRQQTEGAMPLGAIPAGNQSSRRGETFISTMASKPAAASRVQRTAPQTCIAPGLLANVLLAGEVTCEAKLHRPQARTAATVAGLSLSMTPAIVP
jgi:hypothetical protein